MHKITRTDKEIDFKWWGKTPDLSLSPDTFSVTWTGVLVPPVSGMYYLGADGHFGYELYVNDSLLAKYANEFHNKIEYGEYYLEEGKVYNIKLNYFQKKSDNAFVKLLWDMPRPKLLNDALNIAKKSDVVILALGLSPLLEGEEMKVKVNGFVGGDKVLLDLPDAQKRLVDAIKKTGKPIVMVLLNGSAITFVDDAKKVDAIVEAWYPGQAGGEAIASVLWGDYNPAGRLPVTFYRSVSDLPPFDDYNMKGRTHRFFDAKTQFDFGYGLSYTKFKYSKLFVSDNVMKITPIDVTFDITNTGDKDGDEVCQLYLQANGSKTISLQGFERVNIAKGETKTISMQLSPQQIEDMMGKPIDKLSNTKFSIIVGGASPKTKSKKLKGQVIIM